MFSVRLIFRQKIPVFSTVQWENGDCFFYNRCENKRESRGGEKTTHVIPIDRVCCFMVAHSGWIRTMPLWYKVWSIATPPIIGGGNLPLAEGVKRKLNYKSDILQKQSDIFASQKWYCLLRSQWYYIRLVTFNARSAYHVRRTYHASTHITRR